MNTFKERMNAGRQREQDLVEALTERGHAAYLYGQAMLPEHVREALRATESLVRWTADVLCICNGRRVFLIDAKTGTTDTPNYVVEHNAVKAAVAESEVEDVLIVWPDWQVSHAQDVADAPWREGPPKPGRTPYRLIDKLEVFTKDFDAVFGAPRQEQT